MEKVKQNIIKNCSSSNVLKNSRVVLGNSYNELVANLGAKEELVGVYSVDGDPITPVVTNKYLHDYFEEKSKNGYLETIGYLAVAADLLIHVAC